MDVYTPALWKGKRFFGGNLFSSGAEEGRKPLAPGRSASPLSKILVAGLCKQVARFRRRSLIALFLEIMRHNPCLWPAGFQWRGMMETIVATTGGNTYKPQTAAPNRIPTPPRVRYR